MNTDEFLKQALVTREMIDRFLDETAHTLRADHEQISAICDIGFDNIRRG